MREVLRPVFEWAGMQVDFKSNESVLHADSLKHFDVLFIYNAMK